MQSAVRHVLNAFVFDPRVGLPATPTVVQLLPSLAWGGAERLACMMHRSAVASGWNSRVDAPSLPSLDHGLASELGLPVPVRRDEANLSAWSLAARARIRDERPHIVHAHLPYPDRLSAVLTAARGRPLIATFHLLPEPGHAWSPDELLRRRSDRVLAALSRLAPRAHFAAVSETDRDVLARWIPARRLVTVRNAPPPARARGEDPSPMPWPEGAVRLLCVGRLHRQKGFDRLLDALAHPSLANIAWYLVIIGSGPERDALAHRVAQTGLDARVHFEPECAATTVFPTAHIVLSPSRFEGMPLVPFEAVDAGVPVLASSIGPHREVFAAARGSVLGDDESTWPASIGALVASADARASLARAQRAAVSRDLPATMWRSYESLYRTLGAFQSDRS